MCTTLVYTQKVRVNLNSDAAKNSLPTVPPPPQLWVTLRAQSRTSNHKAWFRYPASLVRKFW